MMTKRRISLFLYNFCFSIALPFIIIAKLWRARRAPAYAHGWHERLSLLTLSSKQRQGLWLHAVSLGEVNAALPLIEALLEQYAHLPLTITTTTPTGKHRIQQVLGDRVFYQYLPFDLKWMMQRFLCQLQPKLGIIMESELWPNMCTLAKHNHIPLLLANGRLSPNSQRGYQRCLTVTQAMLEAFSGLAVQSDIDAARYRSLPIHAEQIHVAGNLKANLTLPANIREQGQALRHHFGDRPVWIAASTHATEEPAILHVHRELRKTYPDLLLIMVPRHPERFEEVCQHLTEQAWSISRRSQGALVPDCQVFVGDTMGELLLLYAMADVAFVGGSIAPVGGHNPLEAIALDLPAIMGPEVFNMQALAEQLLAANAMIQISNEDELYQAVKQCLQDQQFSQSLINNGQEFLKQQQTALQKHLDLIAPLAT